jgi:hypothetical protein
VGYTLTMEYWEKINIFNYLDGEEKNMNVETVKFVKMLGIINHYLMVVNCGQ